MEFDTSPAVFVSRHERPKRQELLRLSQREEAAEIEKQEEHPCEGFDSDSDYDDVDESDDDFDDSEPEVDEWRLHAAEPREGLYVHEMKRQRGRMDEKEAQWVRGFLKAQRAWKARTGRSIDEFHVPGQVARRMAKSRLTKTSRFQRDRRKPEQEEEDGEDAHLSLFAGVTRLESLLWLAAATFVCLSLVVQVYASLRSQQA